jgi:hypothetical protein
VGLYLLAEHSCLFSKTEAIAACFLKVAECFRDNLRLKICLKIGMKISEQPLITKSEVLSAGFVVKGCSDIFALVLKHISM